MTILAIFLSCNRKSLLSLPYWIYKILGFESFKLIKQSRILGHRMNYLQSVSCPLHQFHICYYSFHKRKYRQLVVKFHSNFINNFFLLILSVFLYFLLNSSPNIGDWNLEAHFHSCIVADTLCKICLLVNHLVVGRRIRQTPQTILMLRLVNQKQSSYTNFQIHPHPLQISQKTCSQANSSHIRVDFFASTSRSSEDLPKARLISQKFKVLIYLFF